MKNFIVTAAALLVAATSFVAFDTPSAKDFDNQTLLSFETVANDEVGDPFQQGWEEGYCEGWKDVKGQKSNCPLVPLEPLPDIECGDSYRCGYNRGFKYGRCEAQGYDNCKK